MNPFDWRGPAFLVFFACLSALAIGALMVARRVLEDGPEPDIDIVDPYLLACLRAGANEPVIIAILSLFDRGLLVANGKRLQWGRPDADRYVRRPLEVELLNVFKTETDVSDAFSSALCKQAASEYEQTLVAAGALPSDEVRTARRIRFGVIAGALVLVGIIKVLIGLSRNAPVQFLLVMIAAAVVGAYFVHNPRRTRRGDRLLADIRLLFDGLRARAETLRSGRGDSDVTMLAAVFGLAALPAGEFILATTLFPRAKDSTTDWSNFAPDNWSSSSSCGGGGGDSGGGGGCGGCGGGGD